MNPFQHRRAGRRFVLPARVWLCSIAWLLALGSAKAVTLTETFATDPLAAGWQVYGETNLFHWNAANQNVAVTWDSSQTNSYFYLPLGTILSRADDFGVSFDLQLSDLAIGANPAKPNTFELVVGFINRASATDTNFWRGTGINATHGGRSLCEFDYFPDSGYGATISPTLISSNNQFATSFSFPLTLDTSALFHVTMYFTSSNKTLHTTMTRNGQPFGPVADTIPGSTFTDFRLDAIAVCSYSDAGADGSLLAHGTVDNFQVTLPPPPVQDLQATFTNNQWTAQFISRTNWLYTLERATNFIVWAPASSATNGNGTRLWLPDTNPPADRAFYRIRAERP